MACSSARTKDIKLLDKAYNGVHRFRFIIKKDNVVWADIDSVLGTFEKPDRVTTFSVALTAESVANGIWYYDTVVGDLDEVGYWSLAIEVTDGVVILEYPYEIGFRVTNNP